ncbi:MAG: hypothetical protein P9L93_00060 [Candidatus Gorgyraea atricola]|nr:hypothetical protein [Candidatus Gorgyraea atricola]
MRELKLLAILFLMLFLAVPVFAQDAVEDAVIAGEDIELIDEADEGVITGDVVSIDASTGVISVKTADGVTREFSVVDGETILWRGIEDIEISDVKTGEEAEVGYYTDESGTLIASWVDVLVEEEIAPLEVELGAEEETVIEE